MVSFFVKKILKYVSYTFGLFVLLAMISRVNSHFSAISQETYRMVPWQIYALLMYIPVGVYIGLPKLLNESKKPGRWRVNFYKIVCIAFPMMYLSFYWYFPFFYPIPEFLSTSKSLFNFGNMIAGFFYIDSLAKD